jgi:hypothetical protein
MHEARAVDPAADASISASEQSVSGPSQPFSSKLRTASAPGTNEASSMRSGRRIAETVDRVVLRDVTADEARAGRFSLEEPVLKKLHIRFEREVAELDALSARGYPLRAHPRESAAPSVRNASYPSSMSAWVERDL